MFHKKKKILVLIGKNGDGKDRIINLDQVEMISKDGEKVIFHFTTYRYETTYDDIQAANALFEKVFKILQK